MSQWPTATRADHLRFCKLEGWSAVRDAAGRTGTHHLTYELSLPDGRVLRTRISHPHGRTDYGKALWSHVLKDQVHVTEEQFWACVREGTVPDRGGAQPRKDAIPAGLVRILLSEVGLTEAEVAAMSKQDAVDRVNAYWAERG